MADIPSGFLVCRMVGHKWEHETYTLWKPSFGTGLTFLCERCHAYRHDTINGNGSVAVRSYKYPDGYSMVREQTPTRSEMRQQFIRECL